MPCADHVWSRWYDPTVIYPTLLRENLGCQLAGFVFVTFIIFSCAPYCVYSARTLNGFNYCVLFFAALLQTYFRLLLFLYTFLQTNHSDLKKYLHVAWLQFLNVWTCELYLDTLKGTWKSEKMTGESFHLSVSVDSRLNPHLPVSRLRPQTPAQQVALPVSSRQITHNFALCTVHTVQMSRVSLCCCL